MWTMFLYHVPEGGLFNFSVHLGYTYNMKSRIEKGVDHDG
jgi:hypothetical protein